MGNIMVTLFSSDEAFQMIKYAMRYKNTVDPRRLLIGLIANYQGTTPGKIRGVIERFEANNSEETVNFLTYLYPEPKFSSPRR